MQKFNFLFIGNPNQRIVVKKQLHSPHQIVKKTYPLLPKLTTNINLFITHSFNLYVATQQKKAA